MFPLGWIYIDCADPVQPLTKAGEEPDDLDHDPSEELDDLDHHLSDLSEVSSVLSQKMCTSNGKRATEFLFLGQQQ